MRNKTMAALVAGGLLVGAGLVTAVVSAPDTAAAQEETNESDRPGLLARGMEFLGEVLDELVGEGTIDRGQAAAVLDAVEEKAVEMRQEREALRDEIREYLEDGVLTSDEAANIPEDHWLFSDALDEAWADGELTLEEIREARPHPRRDAFKRGARFGSLLDDGGINEAEYSNLPDHHPLKQIDVSEYFEGDGLITLYELREIKDDLRPFGRDT